MDEEEYFTDLSDSDPDSDSGSLSLSGTGEDSVKKSDFINRFKNHQIETLRNLRECLKENKILKKRLEIVEAELEKYHDYGSPNMKPQQDKSTSTCEQFLQLIDVETPDFKTPQLVENNEQIPRSTADQCVQVEIHETKPAEVRIVREVVKEVQEVFIEPKQVVRVLNDEACQTVDDFSEKIKIAELTRDVNLLNKKLTDEITEWENKLKESEQQILELKKNLSDVNRSLDASNERLSEASKKILKLTDESEQIESIRNNETMLRVENGQLGRELEAKQRLLDEANLKFQELAENQKKSLMFIDSQKLIIEKLEDEVRMQSSEASSKLEGLEVEIQDLKSCLDRERGENCGLNKRIDELNKTVERYQQDLKNFNFKEFIAMKRELNSLRQEKERQFVSAAAGSVGPPQTLSTPPLPPIKPAKENIFNFFK